MNFWPEQTGTGKYTGEMAHWLSDQGHEVRCICSAPYYPNWKILEGYSGRWYSHEKYDDVDVYRVPTWIPNKVTTLKRLMYLMFFALSSLPLALRMIFWRPQVVMVIEPTFFVAPTGWLVAKLSGAKSWLHIQDFEIDAAFGMGLLNVGLLKHVIFGCERWMFRRFDRRSTISPKMLELLDKKVASRDGNELFPNWIDLDAITPLEKSSIFREKLGLSPDQSVALYSGNMGEKQGLETVIDAAILLKDHQELVFVLCGAGAAHERLQKRAGSSINIRWLPVQPIETLNELLGLADVHLLPQRSDAADLVMPSKLTGMLASGRPILATAPPGTQVYQLVEKVGKVIPPDDPQLFANTLIEMLQEPETLKQQGHDARMIAEAELGQDVILKRFEQQLLALTSS